MVDCSPGLLVTYGGVVFVLEPLSLQCLRSFCWPPPLGEPWQKPGTLTEWEEGLMARINWLKKHWRSSHRSFGVLTTC